LVRKYIFTYAQASYILASAATPLRFTKEHEWIQIDAKSPNTASIGLTDVAEKALGDVVFIEFTTKIGSSVSQGGLL
jgi:glycine cleavage system H lipoate-binding protein